MSAPFVSGSPPPFISNPSSSTQIAGDTEKQVVKDKSSPSTSANAIGDLNAGYFAYLNANPSQHLGTASFNQFYDSMLKEAGPDLSTQDRSSLQLAALQTASEDNVQSDDNSHWTFNGGHS